MESKITYYDFAENDYLYLKQSVESGHIFNSMCSTAQNCIEKYLKHVVEPYAIKQNNTSIMRVHDLTPLRSFIRQNLPEFSADWGKIMIANGYYFSARYPGDNAFFVSKQDVEDCFLALTETKKAVDKYLLSKEWGDIRKEISPTEKEISETLEEVLEEIE